jgi:leader peptidase (prepilin peptidase) / N-methyltransferase
MFDPEIWMAVPFAFWGGVFFVFGAVVGSFLNVCIHRLPRGESVISPPSHCPHCNYHIPWYLNIPLITWLWLRGHCANCHAPISIRYYLVELLTAVLFWGAWMVAGPRSVGLALVYALFFAALIVATFVDLEHYIIPDEVTLGGAVAGFLLSMAVPALHKTDFAWLSLKQSGIGILFGAGIIYFALRAGKLMLGRQTFSLPPDTKVVFEESGLQWPDHSMSYEEVFYRPSDAIELQAKSAILGERIFENVLVRLTQTRLQIGAEEFNPREVPRFEAVTDQIVVPREAMGLGDVKFMAMIGAFLGWQGVLFSIIFSSFLGAVGGSLMIIRRRILGLEYTTRIAFGPCIAVAAAVWVMGGSKILRWWLNLLAIS